MCSLICSWSLTHAAVESMEDFRMYSTKLLPKPAMKVLTLTFTLFAFQCCSSRAANIVMNGSDALGTSSFNTGLHWTGGVAPTAGNTYQTSTFLLRTPTNATPVTFAGDSLELQ